MTPFPLTLVFGGILAAYVVWSATARLDARYLVGAGMILIVVIATAFPVNHVTASSDFAQFAFLLLVAGLGLLIIEERRDKEPSSGGSHD